MKRQITCLLAVCMLSVLLCGCGRSEKQTAGTKPTAPVQTAAATEAPEPQTLGDIPEVDDIVRCYKELVNGNYGVEYDSSAPLPGGVDGAGEWYPALERYGCADNYSGDEPGVFALCADGHWRIVAAAP